MGQTNSTNIAIDRYVQYPFVTKEDVYQIRNCFEYLKPKDGVVDLSRLDEDLESLPNYMQEIFDDLRAANSLITFDEFFNIMKPRVTALKGLPDDSVIMENTSTSVFCVICPYKAQKNLL